MKPTLPVTVAIPVRNEEANLARCLAPLDRFAELIVIDSGSSDATREIAAAHGARIVDFEWNGRYPKKRNWMLLNSPPEQPWVLFLDADEIVDEAFCDALGRELEAPAHDGYWLRYTNWFLGRRLAHGDAQRKLALFRVGRALYERIEEDGWSGLDMEIHEHPIVEGSVGEIRARIDHHDYRGILKFVDRHRDYARWEASRHAVLLGAGDETWSRLTPRQRFKYRHLGRWWFPWFYFLSAYGARLGVLDGRAGFNHAAFKLAYFQLIRLLIRERASVGPPAGASPADAPAPNA